MAVDGGQAGGEDDRLRCSFTPGYERPQVRDFCNSTFCEGKSMTCIVVPLLTLASTAASRGRRNKRSGPIEVVTVSRRDRLVVLAAAWARR